MSSFTKSRSSRSLISVSKSSAPPSNTPELLFSLRRVDAKDLISQAGVGVPKRQKRLETGKALDHARIADVFGIEMDETLPPTRGTRPQQAPRPEKNLARKPADKSAAAKSKKPLTAKKPARAKPPAGNRAGQRKLTVRMPSTTKPQVTVTTAAKKKKRGASAKAQ